MVEYRLKLGIHACVCAIYCYTNGASPTTLASAGTELLVTRILRTVGTVTAAELVPMSVSLV